MLLVAAPSRFRAPPSVESRCRVAIGLSSSSGTRSRVRSMRASRKAVTASSSRARPALALGRGLLSALPRFSRWWPMEWPALRGSVHESVAKGYDRLLQPRRPAFAHAERRKRIARLFWVAAQLSGTRGSLSQSPQRRPDERVPLNWPRPRQSRQCAFGARACAKAGRRGWRGGP